MAVLGCGYLSQHVFELMFGSSNPEVKVVVKNFAKFTGKHLCRSFYENCEISEIFKGKFSAVHLRTATSDKG